MLNGLFYYVGNIVLDISGISTKVSHDNTWRSHFCYSGDGHPSGDPGLSGMADIQAKASASQAYAWSKAFVNTDIKCPSFRTGI